MNILRGTLLKLTPLIDLALALGCVCISPAVTNLISEPLGLQVVESFSLLDCTPFIAGMAIAGVPFVLQLLGFYHRNSLQRTSTALRQLLSFVVFYLCLLGIYQLVREGAGALYMNHVLITTAILIPLAIFLRFHLFKLCYLLSKPSPDSLTQVILAGDAEAIEKGWAELPESWKRCMNVAGKSITGQATKEQIQSIIEEKSVAMFILFGGLPAYQEQEEFISICELQGIDIYVHLKPAHAMGARARISDLQDHNKMLILGSAPEQSWTRMLKGFLDKVMALAGIIGTSPLWIIAAIGIKISDPKGKIFYTQMRSGLYGKPFRMWKFRSMYSDADQRLDEIKAKYGNEVNGPIFKLTNDPRIFPFGHFIRKTSIDELPQLINILLGDMSVVGPRPLPVYETAEFPDIKARRRLSVKPGLTCYWQVEDRSDATEFETMVEKDFKYLVNWSLWTDFVLILRTVPAVLFGKGAK